MAWIGLKDAAKLMVGRRGNPPSPDTVRDYVTKGYRPMRPWGAPLKLKAVMIGRDWVTTEVWVREFEAARVEIGLERARRAGAEPTAAERKKAHRDAEKRLDAAGCR